MRLFLAALVLIGGAIPAEAELLPRRGVRRLTGRGYRSSTAEILVRLARSILTGADQGR